MAKILGDIAVSVGADVAPLQKGLGEATRHTRKFGDDAETMGRRVAKAGLAITVAVAAAGVAMGKMASEVGKVGAEITNLSKIAGVSTTEFQRLTAAASTVGIGQEKLADIIKDVNDKVGDFMSTGAGPMADFFENVAPKVGVTAEQFAKLSGPEALQLYVSSLEKAGASQQDMTFYMEALASDATAMLPLLRDNGAAMRELGDRAERTGRVLDQSTVEAANRLNNKMNEAKDIVRNEMITALISLEDEFMILAQFAADYVVPAIEAIVGVAAAGAKAMNDFAESFRVFGAEGLDASTIEKSAMITALAARDPSGLPIAGADGSSILPPGYKPPPAPIRTIANSGGGGGGGGRNLTDDFEALRTSFATEYEILAEEYQKQLDQLAEFRANKVATEEEFNALEQKIKEDHAAKTKAIDDAAMQAKLSAVSGAFGDLSSLMQSSNKKLFAIGKAAALAEATVSGYQAAVTAWEKGMKIGGPPVAAAFTAASLAKTGALIAGIASQNAGGSGGSTSGGGTSTATTQAAAPQPLQVSLNTFGGGEFIRRDDLGALFSMIGAGTKNGYVINVGQT